MMLEQHHDDETLIAMLEAGDTNDAHLRACEDCTETLEALKDISSALHHEEVWERREMDERPVGASIAMLRAAADRLQDEAGQAGDLVDDLLMLSAAEAERLIDTDARYQTAGLARRLFDLSEQQLDTDPKKSLHTSSLAVAVSEALSANTYSRETVALLRGSACRQHGFALFYAGRYPEALQFFDRAEAELEPSISSNYEKGRVGIHRTVVNANLERTEEAMAAARRSQRYFKEYGDVARLASARFAEAYVLMKLGQWRRALAIFDAIQADSIDKLDDDMQARVYMNMALCNVNLGHHDVASRHYYIAARLFEQVGTKNEAARMRWQMAHLLRAQGKIEEAVRRFDEVALELEELGMVSETASVHLDTAETLLMIGRFERVEDLCRAALRQYERSGLGYSSRALAALSYLEDVAKQRRATLETVKHVKDYLRRLPHEPALLFAPPPEGPEKIG